MLRSEIESLRSPRVEFWSGTTVHFEWTVIASSQEEDEEEGIVVDNMYHAPLASLEKRTKDMSYLYRPHQGVFIHALQIQVLQPPLRK